MIIINGKTYYGRSITINNNEVIIDGKKVEDNGLPKSILHIEVKGELVDLKSDVSVSCEQVNGSVEAGGSVNCNDVGGRFYSGYEVQDHGYRAE